MHDNQQKGKKEAKQQASSIYKTHGEVTHDLFIGDESKIQIQGCPT